MPDAAGATLAFHAQSLKLRFLAVVAGAASLWFDWLAFAHAPRLEDVSAPALWIAGSLLLLAAVVLWRQGSDPRPVIEVGPEGIRDRLFGEIPWDDVQSYRNHASFFSPCFGYDLKKGAKPPEKAWLYVVQMAMNRLGGLPARNFRRKLIAGGTEPMLAGFRRFRPDLEAA